MADGVEVDSSELTTLAADLTAVGAKIRPYVRKALEVTARHIRDDWREGADISTGAAIVGPYERSIFYDMKSGPTEIEAEIGPELHRPGGTAGFLEEGGAGVLVPPIHAGRDALEKNEQDFITGLEQAAIDALED